MKRPHDLATLTLLQMAMLCMPVMAAPVATHLGSLELSGMTSGWQKCTADAEVGDGPPLRVAGEVFESGIGTHANSVWKLNLAGKGVAFTSKVGVQDGSPGRVEFIVRGDGKDLSRSGPMTGGEPAKPLQVDLTGVRSLELIVDALGDTISDHADWLEPVILHNGSPLPPVRALELPPLLPDLPGEPPNAAAKVDWNDTSGDLRLTYDGKSLFEGKVAGTDVVTMTSTETRKGQAVTQEIVLRGHGLALHATVIGSGECLAAETRGESQKRFPLVRTTIGEPSSNLRNNTVYDRHRDWSLEAPAGAATRITPLTNVSSAKRSFTLACTGDEIRLVFRPRFYQRHKNLSYFRPWTYQVRKDSITGWCSWFVRFRDVSQKDIDSLLAVWKEKRFADYGYRFVQLDDGFQSDLESGVARVPQQPGANGSYPSQGPVSWLKWRKDHFPAGMEGYVRSCKDAGYEPALWIGAHFTAKEMVERHPDWFIRSTNEKPFVAPWASLGVDATNKQAMDTLVRPTFRGAKDVGFSYVKIDLLRHYLYDNLHHNAEYCKSRGVTPGEMFRMFLGAAREELGRDVFILSCWGVLPESIGLADACRIAGDGYGPVSLQQYNSWNGIVWRNDPDACDVYPQFKPAETGNVAKFDKVIPTNNDTVIRPALASISGSMLLLSDKPEVYRDDRNLEGLRRSSPVIFSVPGQLYDFDNRHSATIATMKRESITSGTNPAPCDADQFGAVCPWWLNEYNLPAGKWQVLNRINWGNAAPAATVSFADLGLEADRDYLVYEFWTGTFLGVKRGKLELPAAEAKELRSYAIRTREDHPQIVSTNRHLSQGGVDLLEVKWQGKTLSGRSKVVNADRYELAVHVPEGFTPKQARIAGQTAEVKRDGDLLRVSFLPVSTGVVEWRLDF